jgi:hypothetical protein
VGVVADRLLVDLGADGQVSVGTLLDGELPAMAEPRELVWPLDDDALEDLRWYLEDYLRAPFGVYGERGPRVEAALAGWGQAVFSAVFGAGPPRDAYVKMRARSRSVEVVFRSAAPRLLGLPWELMADPGRPTPLALDVAGVSRSLPVTESAETVPVPGGRLRVLMVISRPEGTKDVGYRMIARPLLERLEVAIPSKRGHLRLVDSCNFSALCDYRTPVHFVLWRSLVPGARWSPDAPRPGWGQAAPARFCWPSGAAGGSALKAGVRVYVCQAA